MPFGTDPTPLIVGLAVVVAIVVAGAWLASRRRRRGPTHALGREESIAYFRDLSGKGSSPGTHEEDSVGRWGGRDGDSRSEE